MAATNFTPISTYYTTTASAVPTAGNLVNGELALNINTADGKLFYKDSAGVVQVLATRDSTSGSFTNLAYTGTLTGGTGVVNLGSGQFYKDASGNVGIGTTTPGYTATNRKVLALNGGTGGSEGAILAFMTGGVNRGYMFSIATDLEIWCESGAVTIGNNSASSPLIFKTNNAERMRITSAGNVGIGSSGPISILEVTKAGIANLYIGYNNTSENYLDADTNIFRNAAGTERMRIDTSGNLLVGQTAVGDANSNSFSFGKNGYANINHVNGTGSGTGYLYFGYNASSIGSITQLGTTAVLYNTTSDYRLKNDVTPIQNALTTINALKPVNFNWIDGRNDDGFLAHEIQTVIPNCVTGEKDAVNEDGTPKYQQMDNSGVIPFLVKAIQEQQVMIETLTTRLNALESK